MSQHIVMNSNMPVVLSFPRSQNHSYKLTNVAFCNTVPVKGDLRLNHLLCYNFHIIFSCVSAPSGGPATSVLFITEICCYEEIHIGLQHTRVIVLIKIEGLE